MNEIKGYGMTRRRKRNPASCLDGARLYDSAPVGFDSGRAFEWLSPRLGQGATTTYLVRRINGFTVGVALALARAQVASGIRDGGDCDPFRTGPPSAVLGPSDAAPRGTR